jgi:hypothetical protein
MVVVAPAIFRGSPEPTLSHHIAGETREVLIVPTPRNSFLGTGEDIRPHPPHLAVRP